MLRVSVLSLVVSTVAQQVDYGEFTKNLKGMAFHSAWGAANERKYGKDMGSWDHLWAKATANLDELKAGIDDDTVSNLINGMSINAAWGAANERAWGKKSDSQVDWDQHKHNAARLEGKLHNDQLATALQRASFQAAWWAANSHSGYDDAQENQNQFNEAIAEIKDYAPKTWPLKAIEQLLKNNAWAAASHRQVQQKEGRFMKGAEENSNDWVVFEEHAQALKKFLGKDEEELFEHLENMVTFAAWAATNERWYGKSANSAQVSWEKFNFHDSAAKALYKGPCDWTQIEDMIKSAAWGAANERAYGQDSKDAKEAWQSFFENAEKVIASGASKGEL